MSKVRPKSVRETRSRSTASLALPSFLQSRPHAIYVGLIALLLVVFFHEAFFSGKVFNVPDNLSPIQYEQGYIQKAREDGINSFWNPYVFSGMPTWGSSSPGHGMYLHTVLDPLKPMLILQVYGIAQAIVNILPLPAPFWDIFNFFLLGLFTYMFGLRRKFEPFTAFLVAVSVVFSLYSLNWIMAGHNTKITVFAWLPALLLLVDMLYERRTILRIALLVVAMHLTFNSGHVQMIFYNLLVVGLYTLYKWYEGAKPATALMVIGITLFAAVFAFLMLSGPYFAAWEYKDFSIRGAGSGGSGHGPAGGGVDYKYATNWSFSFLEIITFFVPSFVGFGAPTYWGSMPFTESPIYLGIVISTLALLGIMLRPKDKFIHFWVVLGILTTLISLGRNFDLVYNLFFNYVPFFNNFRIPSMILYINALVMAMLAGAGLTEIITRVRERTTGDEKALTRKIWIPVGAAAVLVLLLLVSAGGIKETIAREMQKNQPQYHSYMQQVEQAAAQGQLSQLDPRARNLTRDGIYGMAKNDAILALVFMALTAGLVWTFVRGKTSYMLLQAGLLIVLVVDWWIVDYKPMHMSPAVEQEQTLSRSDVVDFLQKQEGLFRILPVSAHGGDNYYVSFGIQSVAGYHPAKMKLYDDVRNSLFREFQFTSAQEIDGANWALLSMLNCRYVVVPTGVPLSAPWLTRVYVGTKEDVYENRAVLPRAFFVGRDTVIASDADMFKTIGTVPGYQPDQIAYLSAPLGRDLPQLDEAALANAKARVTGFTINSITFEVETPAEALLKMSEVYYPSGWTAALDGTPIDILRSDYLLRAFVIPAGKHTLELRFEPKTYEAGLIVTTVTNYLLGIVLLVYLVLWVRRRLAGRKASTPATTEGA